ncbi:MAG: hypothetical protein V3U11_14495, partial [Planctomycetota bacterium]
KAVEANVRRFLDQERFEAMLRVLPTARGETGDLRYLAGYARWALRDLEGAILELQRAKHLGKSGMDEQIANARQDAAPMRQAAGIATRNGWLAVAAAVVLLCGVWFWRRSL